VDGLLEQPVEEHLSRARASAVDAEGELVQVGLVRGLDAALVGASSRRGRRVATQLFDGVAHSGWISVEQRELVGMVEEPEQSGSDEAGGGVLNVHMQPQAAATSSPSVSLPSLASVISMLSRSLTRVRPPRSDDLIEHPVQTIEAHVQRVHLLEGERDELERKA
jgi:hypothetical protein